MRLLCRRRQHNTFAINKIVAAGQPDDRDRHAFDHINANSRWQRHRNRRSFYERQLFDLCTDLGQIGVPHTGRFGTGRDDPPDIVGCGSLNPANFHITDLKKWRCRGRFIAQQAYESDCG